MTLIGALFDGVLALTLVVLAWRTLVSTDIYKAVVLFIAFGLLLALAWVRLAAPDIALAEAAIGAGLTGALLFDALGDFGLPRRTVFVESSIADYQLEQRPLVGARPACESHAGRAPTNAVYVANRQSWMMQAGAPQILLALLTLAFAVALGWAVIHVMAPSVGLATLAAEHLGASGVTHPVTAVLINFRGYDTLLEIAVLVLALLGALSVRVSASVAEETDAASPVLAALVRGLLPLMLVAAGYLLWQGAHAPGGAFQASAILAGALVLARLAGVVPLPAFGLLLRVAIIFGFVVFLGVAVIALILVGTLLEYPQGTAGALILLIETSLMISLALILALLFTGVRTASTPAVKTEEHLS